ncbi:MAG TPA: amino acid permease [Candidatus Merdenecus merdavium]|nr:amino acid permease [Candidatus Merdenecus merdavium]
MKSTSLKKSVSNIEAMAIVVGMIIGSGIFLKPGIVLGDAKNPYMALLAWVLGGIITLASALSIAELSAVIPKAGGLYVYLEELYGKPVGYLLGWVQTIISCPASVAAQAIAFSTYSSFFIPLSKLQKNLLAIGVLFFILLMNILSTKFGGMIQTLATIGKLVPVAAIVVFGLLKGSYPGFSYISESMETVTGSGFGIAVLGTLWAYDGWIGVTNMAGEIKHPEKTLPKVIGFGVTFVILVYALFNVAMFKVLPYETIVASAAPGADAAEALFGNGGGAFITIGIMISVFGALNGYLMTAARVPQSMGARNQLPFSKILGDIHPKFSTPANALIFQSLLAVLYILTGTFNTLTNLLVFVLWVFFVMGVFGVFIVRKKNPKKPGRYAVPFFPFTPLVGIIGGLYILISTIIDSPERSFIGIGITLLGLPVYYWMNKK